MYSFIINFIFTCCVQGQVEGEPKVKKGKTLLVDDDEDEEEGSEASPADVREQSFIVSFISASSSRQNIEEEKIRNSWIWFMM